MVRRRGANSVSGRTEVEVEVEVEVEGIREKARGREVVIRGHEGV